MEIHQKKIQFHSLFWDKRSVSLLILLLGLSYFLSANSGETPTQKSLVVKSIHGNLNLIPAIIDRELVFLNNKPYQLSEEERGTLKKTLLAKFHPQELTSAILKRITDSDGIKSYIGFLDNNKFHELHQSLYQATDIINQESLLAYKEKLENKVSNQQRKKLVSIVDKLNHTSEQQAALITQVQQEIHHGLSIKNKNQYTETNKISLYEEISNFNQTIYLYRFRKTPTRELVAYIDELYRHKALLDDLNIALKNTLLERARLNLQFKK